VFAVIIVIGYLFIRNRRDHERTREEARPVDPNTWESSMTSPLLPKKDDEKPSDPPRPSPPGEVGHRPPD
jgi:hypothetical protein